MSQLTFGEDIFAVLVSVSLILIFVFTVQNYLFLEEEIREERELSNYLRFVSNYVVNGDFSLSGDLYEPFVIDKRFLSEEFPYLAEKMKREGVKIQLKILSLNLNSIYEFGMGGENYDQSISMPIIYRQDNELIPARMIVRARR